MSTVDALTVEQREIVAAIRDALSRAGLQFREAQQDVAGGEPVVTFRLLLPRHLQLDVSVHVGVDLFQLIANGADLRLEVQHTQNDPRHWVRMCVRTMEALVGHDLRIRVRRKLWGGMTGAVWVPLDGGGWNGELFAYLGAGRELVYPWTRVAAT